MFLRFVIPKDRDTKLHCMKPIKIFLLVCSLVDRHRMVNEALSEELSTGLHALSIVAKTEEQWRKMVDDGRAAVEGSPQCRGGFGK